MILKILHFCFIQQMFTEYLLNSTHFSNCSTDAKSVSCQLSEQVWLFLFPFYRWRNTPERGNNFPRKQQSWGSCLGNLAREALFLPLCWNHLINIYWVGIFSKFHKPPGYVTVTGLQTWNDRFTNKWRSEDSQHTRNNKQESLRKQVVLWFLKLSDTWTSKQKTANALQK